jgi:uncharacterized protein YkwD
MATEQSEDATFFTLSNPIQRGHTVRKQTQTMICALLFILLTHLPAAAALFRSAPQSVTLPSANPALVLRQRAVSVAWENFATVAGETLGLNLFEDLTLTAVCEGLSHGPEDSRIWHGHLVGEVASRISVVFDGGHLAVTVRTPETTYKVRPMDATWHVVREIQVDEEAASNWAAAATSDERSVWTLTNQERTENSLSGLSLNGDLVASARAHSADMAAQDYFDHEGLNGSTPGDRIAATGYEAASWGENIAAGYATPQEVVDGWMASDGHRANILSTSYCDIGVGYAYEGDSTYGHYWTQNFGRQVGVTDCPAVSDDSGSDDGGSDDGGNDDGGSDDGGCFIGSVSESSAQWPQ